MNKYEKIIEIIREEYDSTFDVEADTLETLVHKGIIPENAIDDIISSDNEKEDVIPEIIAISTSYDDFMFGLKMDEEENHENKNSDEY
jgi:hypothetical protein